MAGLSPSNQTKKTTSKQIKGLASTFSKIVDNIQFIGGTDIEMKTNKKYFIVADFVQKNVWFLKRLVQFLKRSVQIN